MLKLNFRVAACVPALFALLMLTSVCPQHAYAAALPRDVGAYTYYADNVPIGKVLTDFCTNFGLRLQLAPGTSEKLNGRLMGASATEFLNRITSTVGLAWFYYGGTLYVAPLSDWQTRTFSVSKETMHGLKKAMTDLGILNEQFGWAMVDEQGLVLVSGPTAYLDLIGNTLQSLQSVPVGQQIAVFRLQYASVEDRTLVTRDRQTVIPGVASILRALISGRKGPRAESGKTKSGAGNGAAVEAGSTNVNAISGGTELPASMETGRTNIESDIRLNAIIIKDVPEAMPMYQKLIAALDVPAGLIEIEAMTIDINKTRLMELGIDWAATTSHNSIGFGNTAKTATSGSLALAYSASTTTIVANQAASLIAKVRLLETTGEARVVGKPSILTTDNLPALIDLSQTFYVKVAGERVANLDAVTTGVMLRVTPRLITHTDAPREVQLVIDIEDGTLVDRTGLDLPVVQRSVISTQATISENQSLLIAGHDTETESDSVAKVPGLADFPFFGRLFANKTSERQHRKRMFLITPRIVSKTPAIIKKMEAILPEISTVMPANMLLEMPVSPLKISSPSPRQQAATPISVAPPILTMLEAPRASEEGIVLRMSERTQPHSNRAMVKRPSSESIASFNAEESLVLQMSTVLTKRI